MNLYNQLDTYMLKNHPLGWILGLHIFIPILAVLLPILMGLGYLTTVDLSMDEWELKSNLSSLIMVAGIMALMLMVLFFTRQIKYNSMRIHHSLPYKNVLINLLVFSLIIGGIIFSCYAPYVGLIAKCKSIGYFNQPSDYHYILAIFDNEFYIFLAGYTLFMVMILHTLCSTKIADFGWGMLTIALIIPTYTIFVAISVLGSSGSENMDTAFFLFCIVVAISAAIAFGGIARSRKTLSKAFAIALHTVLPIVSTVVLLYFFENTEFSHDYKNFENLIFWVGMIVGLVGLFGFNVYYRRKYVHPRE